MNLNLPVDISNFLKLAEPITKFLKATFDYANQIVSLIGIHNAFASLIVVGAIFYYMLKGGLAENWWKILIIIIFAILISRI